MGNPNEPPPYMPNQNNYAQEMQPQQPGFINPPPQQYIQPPPAHGMPSAPNVVQTGPVIMMAPQVGPVPAMVTCPSCGHAGQTRTEAEASTKTHLIALVLCLLGCWCCCCIPYCADSCQNINHYCTRCNAFIGAYKN